MPDKPLGLFGILADTAQEYPGLLGPLGNLAVKQSPSDGSGRLLEYYPSGERDSFDPTRPALETFGDKVKPSDVAGDLASHYLRTTDPNIQNYYRNFEASMTPEQWRNIGEQYEWAKKNEGEKREFGAWFENTGLPAYFRGYAFGQWPDPSHWYTPGQMQQFDQMNQYLKTPLPLLPLPRRK